jgi:menaquinone-9 beta-reductase
VARVASASWDLVVVGGGPAGSAAALAARRLDPDARVLLLDKAAFPRDKPCGDGIAPHALDELRALGVSAAVAGYAPVRRMRLRAPSGVQVTGTVARDNYVVPRRVFDARLLTAAQASGVVVGRERVRSVEATDGGVLINGALRARVVVGADGANSAVRRMIGLPANSYGHLAIAVRGYAPAPEGEHEQVIAMVSEGWPAYAWSFPIGDGTANIGYGLLRSRLTGGKRVLHERLAALLPGQPAEPSSLRAHHLPFSSSRPTPGRGRILLAGDAASFVNPLTGEGIYYAIASGRRAGRAALLAPGAPLPGYVRDLRRLLGAHFRQTTALSRLFRHLPLVDAAVRAAAAHPGVFDDFVELGLGAGRLRPSSFAHVVGAYARSR